MALTGPDAEASSGGLSVSALAGGELARTSLGFGFLYASGYFLPALEKTGRYLLPSDDLGRIIVLPSLVAILVAGSLVYASSKAARSLHFPRLRSVCTVLGLSYFTLIALQGVMSAAGHDFESLIALGPHRASEIHHIKGMAFILVVAALLWIDGNNFRRVRRLLSSLGLAFGALAAIRLIILWHHPPVTADVQPSTPAGAVVRTMSSNPPIAVSSATQPAARSRRVVWVIFDEADYNRVFHANDFVPVELPNFSRLASVSVAASNANSPASATLYSIPALLTGLPISGRGILIDDFANLSLESADGDLIPFADQTSIFGKLAARGQSASVLGYYQPYCRLFRLQRCDSFAYPDVGSLDSAIWSNIADFISSDIRGNPWERTTRRTLELLPQYLARDDALTFIHLNVPHLPATYADRALHLATSSDPSVEYSHNLRLSDQILGDIVQQLQSQTGRYELLLVVSTDHWLRNRWLAPGLQDSTHPVLFMVWKVGDTQGYPVSQPLSTVHSASMILDYLDGQLQTQADIARWWADQSVTASFIAPTT